MQSHHTTAPASQPEAIATFFTRNFFSRFFSFFSPAIKKGFFFLGFFGFVMFLGWLAFFFLSSAFAAENAGSHEAREVHHPAAIVMHATHAHCVNHPVNLLSIEHLHDSHKMLHLHA